MAHGYLLQAEYESGYILTEDANDHSPYDPGRNTFHAILNARAESVHGPMVRFSLLPESGTGKRLDVDWTLLREAQNPRPVYFRKMSKTDEISVDGDVISEGPPVCQSHHFGFQFNDAETGENVQCVEQIDS